MKHKNKFIVITTLAMLSLLLITLGASIAFFSYAKKGSTENSVQLGSITFKYTEHENLGNGISIEEAFPMSDEQGKTQTGEGRVFDFKVEANLSRSDIEYEIVAEPSKDSTLPLDAVKFYLTDTTNVTEKEISTSIDSDGNVKTLDSYNDTKIKNAQGKTIYQETILKNTKGYLKKFRARMWIKEDLDWTTNEYMGKTATIRVNVYANSDIGMSATKPTNSQDTSIERITANNKYLFTKTENEEYQYTLNVPNEVEKIDIDVIPSNTEATVEVTNLNRTESLQYEDNYFRVIVTSSDGSKSEEYTLRVYREVDKDNTLFNLSVDGYSLNPIFDPQVTEYELTVEASSVEITATATSNLAIISGIGTKELNWGKNEIDIIVTAQSGETKIYKIIINNERPTAPVITGGSSNWVSTVPTIKVSTVGSAISGVKHYEYYKSTSSASPTNANLINGVQSNGSISSGTTTGDLIVSDEGTNYIWYRTVSTNGFKSEWSNPQVINLDTTIYTITNLITNGSYENYLNDWDNWNVEIINNGYHGNYSLQFNPDATNNYTAMTTQQLSTRSPVLNHKYYGSLMFKSSNTFDFGNGGYADARYEWIHKDDYHGRTIFASKSIKTPTWTKISSINEITVNTYLGENWIIRNFQKGATEKSYADSLMLIDLTGTFGSGKEPDKEWCDKHVHYFDNSITVTWNGISMPIKTIENKTYSARTNLDVNEIKQNDQLEYTFILSSTTLPTYIDFNDVAVQNTSIENLGNNHYKVSGIMTVTEEMLTGLPARDYAFDQMRFFDINGVNNVNLETAHIINYNHFYK